MKRRNEKRKRRKEEVILKAKEGEEKAMEEWRKCKEAKE